MASLATDDNDTTTRRRRTTTEASELPHFEDLRGILQICSGIDTKPGLISYFDDDIHAVINMFAKTSTKFLEYEPLRQKYFKVVLAKKYGFDFEKETIDLDGKNITNEDLRYICELLKANNKVETLDLDNNNITDVQNIGELLKANNTLTTLRYLDLSMQQIIYISPPRSSISINCPISKRRREC